MTNVCFKRPQVYLGYSKIYFLSSRKCVHSGDCGAQVAEHQSVEPTDPGSKPVLFISLEGKLSLVLGHP